MSSDLIDLGKLKVTEQTAAWLESEHRRTGQKKLAIVRDYLHELALKDFRAAKVLVALFPSEGNSGEGGGRPR